MENNRRKRQRKRKNKQQKQQTPTNNGVDFKWEHAFESLTEVGSVFRRNPPEYERDSYSWRQ